MATIPGRINRGNLDQTVITPAPLPTDQIGFNNPQVVLSNQLAFQLAKLFQDLFPISIDYQFAAATITSQSILQGRVETLVEDINQIKMTILTINQITNLAASRIPNGFNPGGPNAPSANIAGLSTSNNNNPVLNILDLMYTDVVTESFGAAQSDYARLRNNLRPYFNV